MNLKHHPSFVAYMSAHKNFDKRPQWVSWPVTGQFVADKTLSRLTV